MVAAHQLAERLQTLEVGEAVEAGGLQVFALRWNTGEGPNYLTLDEGLALGQLEVTEVSEGGSVPTLTVHNRADSLAFLMAGEQLVGAKQNRVLNVSILVAPRSALPIPVSCVEAGRWAYRSPSFSSGGSTSHGKLRRMMHRQVTRSYQDTGTPTSAQGEVWSEVSRKLGAMHSSSPSADLSQAYHDHAARLEEVFQTLEPPEGACGAVFAYGGQIAGLDLFDRPGTLTKLWAKLVRAYALDVLEESSAEAAKVTPAEVKDWLGTVVAAKTESFKSPGVGDDVRLEGDRLIGASLVLDEHPVHVEMFPAGQPA
jgi:ARG and Rhodanese-Phosphatase-superfamily-associated Protein domain